MKKKNKIQKLSYRDGKSEGKERDFWSKVDLSKHFKPSDFEKVSFPNLKASSMPISIRVPEYLLFRIKEKANSLDIPYQSLIKKYISEGVLK
jgi:predicted DNA binding CopG/RHH family protein